MTKIKNLLLLALLLSPVFSFAQNKSYIQSLKEPNAWVDSVFRKLSRKQRIAQMFMVRAHTDKGQRFEDSIANVIKKEHIGGLVFFQGGPGRQAALTNRYQSVAKVPLIISMDAEWGLGMRLDSTISYPYQMTLGAIQDNKLIYQMGKQVAADFKRLGMHVNFAPDADINNNPKNPVIGYRSFGDNKYKVTEKVGAYMKGMQDNDILVSLKHFPGHGDTDVDSHHDLPQLPFSRARLDSLEMYPFRELIKQDASGVMVAHMNIPALDTTRNLPSTLSKPIITGVLKNELGFKGLIFTDAMEMKGVVKFFPNGEADVMAVIAGNDILELSGDTKRAVKLIRKAIRHKRISWDQVNASVKKILAAKYWVGLNNVQPLSTENVVEDLHRSDAMALNQALADAAVTVLNGDSLLKNIDFSKKTALVSFGTKEQTTFQQELKPNFGNSTNFVLAKNATNAEIASLMQELKNYPQIILGVHDTRKRPGATLDFSNEVKQAVAQVAAMNSIVSMFTNPYVLAGLPGIEKAKTLLMNYQEGAESEKAAAKVISGQIKANGKLPVSVNAQYKNGDGVTL
ncbi:MAG TPA: glycoside hydrolase family 3 N-terminal domain-containing protein [Daejeonella sp.]|nr:glycoside hydrolase family 3 N-terminal domain-containing protein [Daejeonella sp.]